MDAEIEPRETAGTELANVMVEGNPDQMLAVLEAKAALAPRMRSAIEQIMLSQTYPADWSIQGRIQTVDGKEVDGRRACLGSAGAERIARNFPIRFYDVTWRREDYSDTIGKAYRYVCVGYASMYERTVYAEGIYSTREEFLGKSHGEWRPIEDINEGDVRSAAHHIFMGAAVKQLLGIRGMPWTEYERIMKATGQDASKSAVVQRGQGTQGGATADEQKHRIDLSKICMDLANAGQTVERNTAGYWGAIPLGEADDRKATEIAADVCMRLSSFKGKDGNEVKGKPIRELAGKRLDATLGTARKVWESFSASAANDAPPPPASDEEPVQ